MNLLKELESRGFVNQITNDGFFGNFEKGGQNFYCGYDPTADSLHLGHLVTIMAAVNFMKRGNKFYLLIGGATGMIGDPGGKDEERVFLSEDILRHNQDSIKSQVDSLLKNLKELSGKSFDFEVINNFDFYKNMGILDFLRKIGKHITVNTMISKDIIRKRVEDPDKSISYTEFSYTLLQGYDFLYLLNNYGVSLQIAGSDQWGNITTGTELIRKINNTDAYGFTVPLILDSNGRKFGKSEGNAIWIDRNKNSPYFVYQYFLNTSDDDLDRFLKLFTLLDLKSIREIMDQHLSNTESRMGQKVLADYVVTILFGKKATEQANKITDILFGGINSLNILEKFSKEELLALYKEIGGIIVEDNDVLLLSKGKFKILDLCTQCGISKSNTQAKQLIQSGSIFCNEKKIDDIQTILTIDDFVNNCLLIRKGKKNYKLIYNI